MNVFVLGGTGSIGSAVVAELIDRGHDVTALSRSAGSDARLLGAGASPVRGDLRDPALWCGAAVGQDVVIQVAATFDEDMGAVDAALVDALIEASRLRDQPLRVIYTGGCWLYGETGDRVAVESDAFAPIAPFAWMVSNARRLREARSINLTVVHPAMTYSEEGGVFERFLKEIANGGRVEIWGSASARWPLVHRTDLARAYCDLAERADLCGDFNVSAQEGVRVRDIVAALGACCAVDPEFIEIPVSEAIARHGAWTEGPALDQQMSAAKLRDATGWSPARTDVRAVGFKAPAAQQ